MSPSTAALNSIRKVHLRVSALPNQTPHSKSTKT